MQLQAFYDAVGACADRWQSEANRLACAGIFPRWHLVAQDGRELVLVPEYETDAEARASGFRVPVLPDALSLSHLTRAQVARIVQDAAYSRASLPNL